MAMEKYFAVNTGSASKKYALYAGGRKLFSAHFEKEQGDFIVTLIIRGRTQKIKITDGDFQRATDYVFKIMAAKKLIRDRSEIKAVGLRIVARGTFFLSNKLINKNYFKKLLEAKDEAPLHLLPVIKEVKNLQKSLPGVPVVGISDSAFHVSMPDYARQYGLPHKVASRLDIYRFGYHGISAQSIVRKIKSFIGKIPSRIVICHLGSGSSITAVKNGKSLDTSMGFTPLEGLLMNTRVGNIDAGAITYLEKKLGFTPEKLERYLNSRCGLLGISGKTGDIRELLVLEKSGNKQARLALAALVYGVKKYIGAYTAALNGLDFLVFSAAIGERSFIMRDKICQGLENLGIKLDVKKNNRTVSRDGFIHHRRSAAKIAVITTNEMEEIVVQTKIVLNK